MSAPPKLSEQEIAARLSSLDGWVVQDGALHRELELASFVEAFAFMTAVALHAQRMNHHPDWSNSFNRVVIDLSSHDVGGISDRDFRLAALIDAASAAAQHGG